MKLHLWTYFIHYQLIHLIDPTLCIWNLVKFSVSNSYCWEQHPFASKHSCNLPIWYYTSPLSLASDKVITLKFYLFSLFSNSFSIIKHPKLVFGPPYNILFDFLNLLHLIKLIFTLKTTNTNKLLFYPNIPVPFQTYCLIWSAPGSSMRKSTPKQSEYETILDVEECTNETQELFLQSGVRSL